MKIRAFRGLRPIPEKSADIASLPYDVVNFEQAVEHAQASFGKKIVLVQYPVNPGTGFNQVVDVLKMEMYQWKPEGGKPEVLPIPDSEKEKAAKTLTNLRGFWCARGNSNPWPSD